MSRVLAALWRRLRNGDARPTSGLVPGCVSPSPAAPAAAPADQGDGPEPACSQDCGRPGTCTWECDGNLYRVCVVCCAYCNPGGDLDAEQRRRRLLVGAVVR